MGPKGPAGINYTAEQDLCTATTRSTVAVGGTSIHIGAVVAADDNVVVLNVSFDATPSDGGDRTNGGTFNRSNGSAGATSARKVRVKLWATKGDVTQPFDQATCGPDNMPRGGYILPTTATLAPDGQSVTVTRSSARSGVNSAVVATCAPYVNDGVQNVTVDTAGNLQLADGRCIVRVPAAIPTAGGGGEGGGGTGKPSGAKVDAKWKTTVGVCNTSDPATQWVYNGNRITSAAEDGFCLAVDPAPSKHAGTIKGLRGQCQEGVARTS